MIKLNQLLVWAVLLFIGCTGKTPKDSAGNIDIANAFVDAFYSFKRDSLQTLLSAAETSRAGMLYYQKWAECGNYQVLQRDSFFEKNDSTVIFPVTVKDDLMAALQIDFNVTDTFRITIRDGKIHDVQTSSNDPDEYYIAKEWVYAHRPQYVEEVCKGIWAEGPTPCECIQGMLKGFQDYKAQESQDR